MTVESIHAIAFVMGLVGILSDPLTNGIHGVVFSFSQTNEEQELKQSRHFRDYYPTR